MSRLGLTLGWVASAVGGTLEGTAAQAVGDVVTDSRVARDGDLFIALRGPRFDAHDFVPEVLAQGAAVVVSRAGLAASPVAAGVGGRAGLAQARHDGGGGVIAVADTLQALQNLAHAIRKAVPTKVIAITGSAGKTTTKETMAALLDARFRVVKNKGNFNNHIGLPLSLLQLRSSPDVAVMELGMNHAGEISTLVAIAEPDVRVWTNVGDAHLGFFASPDAIADAKAEILERATPATVLVANADDARVMARVPRFTGRVLTFGTAAGAAVRAIDVEDRGLAGMRARVQTPVGERTMSTPLLGRGNLSNVLAATAVALELGIDFDTIAGTVAALRPAERRGAVHRLRGVTLVDDSYNSSPSALRRALDVVAHEPDATRKIAVLGEMLELGEHSTRLHEECGRVAASSVDRLICVGGDAAKAMAAAARAAGLSASAVSYFEGSDRAADAVAAELRDGDLLLVKGSRGIRTDVVVDRVMKERG